MKKKSALLLLTVLFSCTCAYSQNQSSGYVPVFDKKLNLENGIIYQNTGSQVGIGTSFPNARLDVVSIGKDVAKFTNSENSSTLLFTGAEKDFTVSTKQGYDMRFETSSASGDPNPGQLVLHNDGTVAVGGSMIYKEADPGIGGVRNDTIAKFPESSSKSRILLYYNGSSGAGILNGVKNKSLLLATTAGNGTINDSQLYLSPNGNVGIGTSSPSTIFEINNGTLKLSGYIGNDEENARFVIHTDNATNYNFMELRNINGVQFKVTGTGIVYAKEIKVTTNIPTPDYVFEKDYNLMTISELEKFIFQNKHLPNVPSAKEVEETGMNLAALSNVLLEKVEELTLYTIQQQKLIEELIESQNHDRELIRNLQDQINRLKYESE